MKIKIKKKWIITGIVLILMIIVGYFIFRPKPVKYNLAAVERGNLTQLVSVTGTIKPAQSVDLSFEKAGKVSQVYVDVGQKVSAGQILVAQSNADLLAQLSEAQASVKAQEAKLDELKQGTQPKK